MKYEEFIKHRNLKEKLDPSDTVDNIVDGYLRAAKGTFSEDSVKMAKRDVEDFIKKLPRDVRSAILAELGEAELGESLWLCRNRHASALDKWTVAKGIAREMGFLGTAFDSDMGKHIFI